MTISELIVTTCNNLIAQDYRAGFDNCVTSHCKNAIAKAGFEEEAATFWNEFCCFTPSYQPEDRVSKLSEKYGAETIAVYLEAVRIEKLPGCFVMPKWGMGGT